MALEALHAVELTVHGPIRRSDLPGLCARIRALLETTELDAVLCSVRGVEPDAVTVDALARLQLAARRHRCRVLIRHASAELLDLVAFMGLEDVLAPNPRGEQGARRAGTPARCRGRT